METLRRAAADTSEEAYQMRSRRDAQELLLRLLRDSLEEATHELEAAENACITADLRRGMSRLEYQYAVRRVCSRPDLC